MEAMQGQHILENLAVSSNHKPVDGEIVSTSTRKGHPKVSDV
jgi:hypothetical protein